MDQSCDDQTLSMLWKDFGKFYCISLKDRTDRRLCAMEEFKKIGLEGYVQFYIVDKHPYDCEKGIFESHLACLEKGIKTGARRIIIFEDDVVFKKVIPSRVKAALNYMKTVESWDMFFLGCLVTGIKKTCCSSVVRIQYRSLTHAMVVKREFAGELVKKEWKHLAYDDMLRGLKSESYAMYPLIAFQSNAPSDNERLYQLDRFRRIFGGLEIIQRVNEYYCFHKGKIIAAHVVLLILTGFFIHAII